jgi:hypothetical protein
MHRFRPLLAFVALGAAGLGCNEKNEPPPVTLTSSDTPEQNGRSRLFSLEEHLQYGKTWGSDATAKDIAAHVVGALVTKDWFDNSDLAVAVEILPYAHRRIVVLVKMRTLGNESQEDRRGLLHDVQLAVAEKAAATDEVAIGIRGPLSYSAAAAGGSGAAWITRVEKPVSTEPLERALATSR